MGRPNVTATPSMLAEVSVHQNREHETRSQKYERACGCAESMKGKRKLDTLTTSRATSSGNALHRTTKRARTSRTAADIQEDAYIAYLEKKLGYGGGKAKPMGDGLDDLFDFATSLDGLIDNEMEVTEDDEQEVDEDDQEHEEWGGIPSDSGAHEAEEAETIEEPSPPAQPKVPAATTYVPPHLRVQEQVVQSEEVVKLTRQLKGLINRMSEQNLGSILDSIEEMYRNHRRNDVTTTITTLIIDAIASHSSLLDSFVVLHAAFIASLHRLVGIEFVAYFIQTVIALYEKYFSEVESHGAVPNSTNNELGDGTNAPGKECTNLVVLLSELYNFQVISAVLIYDIIRALLDGDLTEIKVELLLKITRNSGQQLHQDDPSALKDIIQMVYTKVSGRESSLSSRARFMIETLDNLKNNKSKRNAAQNQGGDTVERMKKFLTNLAKKRHVMSNEPLRVTLNDLHSAETKGKWWLVGAAWAGDPLVEKGNAVKDSAPSTQTTENSLLKLARKQGMNTDIRRSIFVVLMSSDDYVDACERLSQLNLSEVQQREIVRVLLHCCGNEKAYNPYYALVCQNLCRLSHSYKITVQFCLWDFLRDLGESTVGGAEVIKNIKDDAVSFDLSSISKVRMQNVAKAYGWWIAKDCVSLAILKPIDFTTLKPHTTEFLKEMLVQIYLNSQATSPILASKAAQVVPVTRNKGAIEEVFIKATRIEALAMGLVYFITHAFKNTSGEEELVAFVKWANNHAKDTLRTGLDLVAGSIDMICACSLS
ncbi:hypothetical protein AX16_002677 [Volvariella volvacea WC 439]|nr:hypothetical protein AX16_002677 [Volvariella volvacea WC 439]